MAVNDEANRGSAPRRIGERLGSDLRLRVAAAVALGLAALVIAWTGAFVFVAFWWAASVIVLGEWQRIVRGDRLVERVAIGALALAVAALFAMHSYALSATATLAAGALAVGWFAGPAAWIWAGAGVLYAGALIVSLGLLRASPSYGLPAILWLFAVVWGTDVAAYFGGRLIGGPRLWPSVSPGKTWSGAAAGAFAGAAFGLLLSGWTNRIDLLFWLGLAAAIVAELGDLFESALKRRFGVKDFEPPHPGPRRPHGQARRLHRRIRLRRAVRRRQHQRLLHRQRAVSMVSRHAVSRAAAARVGARPRSLAILGATGSIGRSCARVIGAAPGRFSVASVASGRDGAALARLAVKLGAEFAAVADPAGYGDLKAALAGSRIEAAAGIEAVREAALRQADLVVSAIVGAAGLEPTFAAIAAGRTVALANKETLVCAGGAVMRMAKRSGALLLPMDSEHNALFQAIGARNPDTIEMMTITASGGPFREWSAERIASATREEALAHPNWVMGPKVTVDSAGLMNKGLELIEAHFLFGLPPERLDVVVHPQSIVHGLIAFADGSLIAGMASPDMRTPIAHCLAYPDRIVSGVRAPDLAALGRLTFERADLDRFPALGLAIDALKAGGGAPTALNAANEVAVAAFLDRRIGFGDIARLVSRTISAMQAAEELAAPADVAHALAIYHIAVDRASGLLA